MANELQLLVEQSGLEKSKAQYMLDNFTDDFRVAAEWETKVKTIVVTDASQTGTMKMARAGRLFLRDRRIKVEAARKHLKEQSLREGKAIDGIANVLKALIVPMEEHLYRQEHFVEIQLKAKAEQKRIETEQQVERDRLAREKAEAEERERIRLENVRLHEEAKARERKLFREQVKRNKAERAKKVAQAKAAATIETKERTLQKERQKLVAAKAQIVEAEKKRKEAEEQQAQAKIDMEQKLAALGDDGQIAEDPQIICPFCNGKFYLSEGGVANGNHEKAS